MPEPTYPVPFFAPGQKSLGRVRNSEDWTWPKLVAKCMEPALVGAPAGATDGELNVLKAEAGAWSPGAVFLKNKRSQAALLTRSILAIDCDGPLPEDALDTANILGWSAVAHTTYKSNPDAPRWRVMLPLDQVPDTPQTQGPMQWMQFGTWGLALAALLALVGLVAGVRLVRRPDGFNRGVWAIALAACTPVLAVMLLAGMGAT